MEETVVDVAGGEGGSRRPGASEPTTAVGDLRIEGVESFWQMLNGLRHSAERAAAAAERAADAAERAARSASRATADAQVRTGPDIGPDLVVLPPDGDHDVRATRAIDEGELTDDAHGGPPITQIARMFAQARADRAQAWADREAASRLRHEVQRERDRWQTDELTGVLTRRAGEERTRAEIDRAVRLQTQLVCAFVDVAGLKAVNDTYGHAAGDEALRAVAGMLHGALRGYDVVFRYGGDEFVCILPEAPLEAVTRRFRALVQLPVPLSAGQVGLHVGIAALQPADSPASLVGRADADMYARRRESDRIPPTR